jgi:hypothetical protein
MRVVERERVLDVCKAELRIRWENASGTVILTRSQDDAPD